MYQAVIVDDEQSILEGLKNVIDWEGCGFEVVFTAANPLNALDYIRHNPVSLLVTDVSMPQMNGIELTRQCKEANPLLSVLVISAFDKFEYVRAALRLGAENYILKPLDADELSASVGQLAHHMRERELLSEMYGINMLTFRSTFVENWVRESISTNELRTRAELLGVNLDADNYTVVIFSVSYSDKQTLSQFFEYFLSVIINRFVGHFYFETQSRLVCILSKLPSEDSGVTEFLQQLLVTATLLEAKMSVCIGSTVTSFAEVPNSYKNAHALLFAQYIPIKVLSYEMLTTDDITIALPSSMAGVSADVYLTGVLGLFTSTLSKEKQHSIVLTILAEIFRQTGSENTDFYERYPQLVRLLGSFPSSDADAKAYSKFCESCIRLCYSLTEVAMSSMYPCVDAVMKAVHEFSDKDISLKTLATKLNVSPSYLGNAFHQQTGYYFNEYLTEARLKLAAELIESTDGKMKDIVESVGFSSQTYFNRTFKRRFGVSPMAYKRQKRIG